MKSKLPTKKGSGEKKRAPTAEAIKKCLEFPESVGYLLNRLESLLKPLGLLEKSKDLMNKIREYAEDLKTQRSLKGNDWAGDLASERSLFENLQNRLAEEALALINSAINEPLKLDFALSDQSQFLRQYSVNGEACSGEVLDSCDKLFNAWLAENKIMSLDGQLYDVSAKGEALLDSIPDSEKIKALMTDSKKGLQAYFAKRGLELQTQEHPFQKPAVEAAPVEKAKTKTATAAAKVAASVKKQKPAAPGNAGEPDVVTPTGGGTSGH